MAAESAAQTASTDGTSVNWRRIWDSMNSEPHESLSMTQLAGLVSVYSDAKDESEAANLIQEAREIGELDHNGSGYVLESEPEPEPEPAADHDREARLKAQDQAENQSTASEQTRTSSASGEEIDVEAEIGRLDRNIESVHGRLSQIKDQNEVIMKAMVKLAGEDSAVLDEIPQLMSQRSKEISRMSRTISKVSEQLDGLGQANSKNKRTPKEDRIISIQKGLVKENTKVGSSRWRDVDIMKYLDGQGVDLAQSTCSNLLNDAAESHEAFTKQKNRDGRKVLAVDLDKIDDASILRPKNDSTGKGA